MNPYHDAEPNAAINGPQITPREVFLELVGGVADQNWDALSDLYAEDATVRHPFATNESALLEGREQIREHFATLGALGLIMQARDITIHETTDPEVIVAEFTYHGRAGAVGGQFLRPAIFVLKIRDGQIIQSHDYLGEPQRPNS